MTFGSLNPPRIEVGEHDGLSLSLQPMWHVLHEDANNRRVLLDIVRCVTRSEEPKPWFDHLDAHNAVRDLLTLSRWHDESCVEVFALRDDDPLIAMDGENHGDQWREIVIAHRESRTVPTDRVSHLIEYAEIGASGLLRWLKLRDEFKRALDPVITSKRLGRTTANTLLAHTGPGLEALGYLLLLRDGCSKKQAKEASLKARFERILTDLGDSLPFDGSSWIESTTTNYNGLKHANRKEPDSTDVLNSWRECAIVTRAWVAVELGVSLAKVKERLSRDPHSYPHVKVG